MDDYQEQIDSLHKRLCRTETALYKLMDFIYDNAGLEEVNYAEVLEIQTFLSREGFVNDKDFPKN